MLHAIYLQISLILFTTVHNRLELFSQFPSVSCKTKKRTLTHQTSSSIAIFSKRNWKKPLNVCRECIPDVALDLFRHLDACGKETYQTVCRVLILPYFYERTLFYREKNYKHTHGLEYYSWGQVEDEVAEVDDCRGWQKYCSLINLSVLYPKKELARGRTAALYNRTSFGFVASQDLVSVDTFHWRPAELEDLFREERVSSRREESAVVSDCWFACAFLYDCVHLHMRYALCMGGR